MNIYVFADWFSKENYIGTLYAEEARGSQSYSFEFSNEWLKFVHEHSNLTLDPELQNYSGRQFLNSDKKIFGMFADACPDRWGRTLLQRRENIKARNESRNAKTLNETDFLLGVYDESRMGALRFKTDPDGPFIDYDENMSIPPITNLRGLEANSLAYENGYDTSNEWLKQLIAPGSSLGGARPKATVKDSAGALWIAKFPSKHDEYDQAAFEMLAHELAKMCGINVPEASLKTFSKSGSTFLVKRFDRDGEKRLHFASAMSLLNLKDGNNASDGHGYLEIAEFIRAYGKQPQADLKELFKRIAFSIAISNTDDHFRNHGFLLEKDGWKLSPAFDVNPSMTGDSLSLNINERNSLMSSELLLSTASQYLLPDNEAAVIIEQVMNTVQENWRKVANRLGISRESIEDMSGAFRRKD